MSTLGERLAVVPSAACERVDESEADDSPSSALADVGVEVASSAVPASRSAAKERSAGKAHVSGCGGRRAKMGSYRRPYE